MTMDHCFIGNTVEERIRDRLRWIDQTAGDTIGAAMQLELLQCDELHGQYRMLAHTVDWMRNVIGTLHGGSCAAMVDQAMGCVANSLFADETHAPTSQLQLNFHRPMEAGEKYIVDVRVVSVSRSLIHLAAEVYAEKMPDKLCVSSTSVFFRGKKKCHKGW